MTVEVSEDRELIRRRSAWASRTIALVELSAGRVASPELAAQRQHVRRLSRPIPDPLPGLSFAALLDAYALLLGVSGWADLQADEALRILAAVPEPGPAYLPDLLRLAAADAGVPRARNVRPDVADRSRIAREERRSASKGQS